jgi:O-antigen ligase
MNIIRFNRNEGSPTLAAFVSNGIIQYLLPVGFFVLLTGLFWLGEKSLYHRLYYLLVAVPTLAVFLLRQTGVLKKLLRNPIIIAFILFGAYTILTLFLSDTDHAIISLARRPLNILLLFLAFGLVALKSPGKIFNILSLSAKIAAVCGGLSLTYFLYTHYANGLDLSTIGRFSGYGAIHNPLLTSHVYGFFTAFFLALWFSGQYSRALPLIASLAILAVVVISTGSRTPLLALTITLIWLSLCHGNRRSLIAIGIALSSAFTLLLSFPEAITQRGLSYRPEIWLDAFQQGLEKFWFGHGFEHSLNIHVETTEKVFYDPHNIELAVFLSGGIVGLTLWLALYAIALHYSWRNRDNYLVMISSALLVFGFAAGLTEGGEFLTRPKEHWFLIWIPFALLSSTWIGNDHHSEEQLEKLDQ